MKKIVYFLLIALCLPLGLRAQSADDDLYFIPSKDKKEKKETPVKKEPKKQVTTNIYTSPGTTVVIQDRKGKTRDVDEYNRRYDARDYEFEMQHDTLYNDTLYIKEKKNSDLDGEWVNGEFDGSQEDYEYAERIIRFRNPRFAVSINSPLYWDMVYGVNSWDWNVYTDGFYAYAFPTFGNPYWWDWRFNSYGSGWNYGWGWNNWGWNRPYCGWGYYPGYYGSYWGGWYGGGSWGHHHHWGGGPSWGGVSRPYYGGRSVLNANNRARYSNGSSYNRRGEGSRGSYQGTGDRGTSNSRVVGTRNTNSRVEGLSGNRGEASRRGSSTYTRPSSTGTRGNTSAATGESSTYRRSSSTETRRNSSYTRGTSSSSSRGSSTYSRGNSSPSSRESSTYSRGSSSSSRSSSTYSPSSSSSRSSSSPSYTPSRSSSPSYSGSSSSGSSRSSSGSSSSGSSSRSSGGGSSRSSGGGSRR